MRQVSAHCAHLAFVVGAQAQAARSALLEQAVGQGRLALGGSWHIRYGVDVGGEWAVRGGGLGCLGAQACVQAWGMIWGRRRRTSTMQACSSSKYTSSWKILYVRVTRRRLNGYLRPTIDLANLEATKKGKGAFRRLVEKLSTAYPGRTLFVESVQSERFLDGLLRMGFVRAFEADSGRRLPANLYLPLKGSG